MTLEAWLVIGSCVFLAAMSEWHRRCIEKSNAATMASNASNRASNLQIAASLNENSELMLALLEIEHVRERADVYVSRGGEA